MKQDETVYIVCTGFGSFHGVDSNPSQWIVEQLQKVQSSTTELQDTTFEVLEVAARYVTDALRQLATELKDRRLIWCHLGVDAHADHFKLEIRRGGSQRSVASIPLSRWAIACNRTCRWMSWLIHCGRMDLMWRSPMMRAALSATGHCTAVC